MRSLHAFGRFAAVALGAVALLFLAARFAGPGNGHAPLRAADVVETVSLAGQYLLPVRLVAKAAPDMCVSVRRSGPDNGKQLVLAECETNPDAFIVPEGFAAGQIRWAAQPSLCLEAAGGDDLRLWDCSRPALVNVNFKVGMGSAGAIKLAAHPDKCIRAKRKDGFSIGARLRIEDCGSEGDEDAHFELQIVRVDCDGVKWEWSEWSSCSKPCGGGYRLRSRKVAEADGGGTCNDLGGESSACHEKECTPELLARLNERGGGYASVYGGELQPVRIGLLDDPRMCLGVERIRLPMGKRLELRECRYVQDTFLIPKGFGKGPIRWAEQPELCLDAPGHTQLQFWNCSVAPDRNTQFLIDTKPGHGIFRQAAVPYKCLDVPGTSNDNPQVFLQMWDCDSAKAGHQRFTFTFFYEECMWGAWSEWSACHCEPGTEGTEGVRHRSRDPDAGDGRLCAGAARQDINCFSVHCNYGSIP